MLSLFGLGVRFPKSRPTPPIFSSSFLIVFVWNPLFVSLHYFFFLAFFLGLGFFYFCNLNLVLSCLLMGADIVVDNCAICRNHIMDLCE